MTPEKESEVIAHLETLNKQIALQNSLPRMFVVGIIYGVGFFVGSAVIATIAFGILGPIFGRIAWVHDAFVQGVNLLR